jgi:hypothetical protein
MLVLVVKINKIKKRLIGTSPKQDERTQQTLLSRAENETRTRDPQLGKLMLYQLSYFRR